VNTSVRLFVWGLLWQRFLQFSHGKPSSPILIKKPRFLGDLIHVQTTSIKPSVGTSHAEKPTRLPTRF